MRCFVGFKIPDEALVGVVDAQRAIEASASGFYDWVHPDQMHLTLYFLGELDERIVLQISDQLLNLSSEPFEYTLSGLVRLPEPDVPKVLASGFGGDKAPLKRLHQRVSDIVLPLAQFKETRAFFPHITFGRLKRGMPGNAKALKKALANVKLATSDSFTVSSIDLFKSSSTSKGQMYETIETFRLG